MVGQKVEKLVDLMVDYSVGLMAYWTAVLSVASLAVQMDASLADQKVA